MAAGLGLLRLEPRAFWSMTLREIEAALRGLYGVAGTDRPPARADLTAMMQQFPDRSIAR